MAFESYRLNLPHSHATVSDYSKDEIRLITDDSDVVFLYLTKDQALELALALTYFADRLDKKSG